ncbi:MAG: hypothetical protein ACPGF7_15760, partial [Pontibacterium sp.]
MESTDRPVTAHEQPWYQNLKDRFVVENATGKQLAGYTRQNRHGDDYTTVSNATDPQGFSALTGKGLSKSLAGAFSLPAMAAKDWWEGNKNNDYTRMAFRDAAVPFNQWNQTDVGGNWRMNPNDTFEKMIPEAQADGTVRNVKMRFRGDPNGHHVAIGDNQGRSLFGNPEDTRPGGTPLDSRQMGAADSYAALQRLQAKDQSQGSALSRMLASGKAMAADNAENAIVMGTALRSPLKPGSGFRLSGLKGGLRSAGIPGAVRAGARSAGQALKLPAELAGMGGVSGAMQQGSHEVGLQPYLDAAAQKVRGMR